MAKEKITSGEEQAAEEAAAEVKAKRASTDRLRLWWAAAFMMAVVVFVAGYAVGNATGDDDVTAGERPGDIFREQDGPFGPGADRAPGPRGGFQFDLPDDSPLPVPRQRFGFDFECAPNGACAFHFPEGLPLPFLLPFAHDNPGRGFDFNFECTPDGTCTFHLPDGFDFPRGPFSGDDPGRQGPSDQVPAGESGFLGVSVVERPGGVVVAGLDPGSPADEAGIAPGDVFVTIDDVSIDSIEDLVGTIVEAGAGTQVTVTVDRDGTEMSFDVVLTSPPS